MGSWHDRIGSLQSFESSSTQVLALFPHRHGGGRGNSLLVKYFFDSVGIQFGGKDENSNFSDVYMCYGVCKW